MAWSFEFRAGVAWAVVIAILMIVAIWAEVAMKTLLPLLLPVIAYAAFLRWVFTLKK